MKNHCCFAGSTGLLLLAVVLSLQLTTALGGTNGLPEKYREIWKADGGTKYWNCTSVDLRSVLHRSDDFIEVCSVCKHKTCHTMKTASIGQFADWYYINIALNEPNVLGTNNPVMHYDDYAYDDDEIHQDDTRYDDNDDFYPKIFCIYISYSKKVMYVSIHACSGVTPPKEWSIQEGQCENPAGGLRGSLTTGEIEESQRN